MLRRKKTHTAIEMPAKGLAARSPMMPLARSRLRPATGPATEPVRARAAGAGGGPAPTAAPITTVCDNFFATLTAACSALEARAPTVPPAQALWWSITLWGRRVVARGPRGQGSGQVERGHTSVDFWAIQAARAAAAPCSSSGNTRRWHR